MIGALMIGAGYVYLIFQFGGWGVAVVAAHIGIMLLASSLG